MRHPLLLRLLAAAVLWVGGNDHEAQGQTLGRSHMKLLERVSNVVIVDEHRSTTEDTMVFEALTSDGAQGMTTVPLSFQGGQQTLEILDAYTLKQDGRRLPVTDSQIQKQVGQLGGSVGLTFPERHTWQLKFPDVQVGDRTYLKYRMEQSVPGLPGWHHVSWIASDPFAVQRLALTLRAPTRLPWHLVAHGIEARRRVEGTFEVWEVNGSAGAANIDANAVNVLSTVPGVVASSFASPQAMGDAFGRSMFAKVSVTPAIRSIADEATGGLTQRDEIVRALYDWVRKNLRYSAVFLGVGAWVPRDLDDILSTRFGDCKDHTLVLISLLKAKSIDAVPALISLAGEYELLPTGVHQFNHVIVHVPASGVYLDTTSAHTPLGQLPYLERGKPVVLARPAGSSVARVPSLEASGNVVESIGDYEIDAAGNLKGILKLHLEGHAAMNVQARLAQVPAGSSGSLAARKMLEQARMHGQASLQYAGLNRDEAHQDVTIPVEIENFLASPDAGSILPNPRLPFFGPYVQDNIGNYSARDRSFAMRCTPITVRERFTLRFDARYKLNRVPPAVEERGDLLHYTASYRQEGHAVMGVREYVDSNPTMTCSLEQYKARQPVVARILRHLKSPVVYEQ